VAELRHVYTGDWSDMLSLQGILDVEALSETWRS
jgi:hypothetical protein